MLLSRVSLLSLGLLPCSAAGLLLEAERAFLPRGGHILAALPDFTGTGYVQAEKLVFTVFAEVAAEHDITVRARGATELAVAANGLAPATTTQPASSTPEAQWTDLTAAVALHKGLNTVSLELKAAKAQVDHVRISGISAGASRGATKPFTTYEAEAGSTNAQVLDDDRTLTTHSAECSQRRCVKLTSQGHFVEVTTTQQANAVAIRLSIPDSPDGAGINATVSLYVNGQKHSSVPVTSRYSWYYGGYPYNGRPGEGKDHHLFDEVRVLLGSTLAAGSKVRVQVDAGDAAAYYVVDLVDGYDVPAPLGQPQGSISIVDHGADPTGAQEASDAIDAAKQAAGPGGTVWIPQGHFKVTRHTILDDITVRGAGPWYSFLAGDHVGMYGKYIADGGPSKNVGLYDFAIIGEVKERNDNDQVNGVGGALSASTVQNVYIQHTKVGLWLDGPMDGLHVVGNIVRDLTADGLNCHQGCTNLVVEQNHIRNSGDDGIALWSEEGKAPDSAVQIRFNTVELPNLANNIALYGGTDLHVVDNIVTDQLWQGGGILVAPTRFGAVPMTGDIEIARNSLLRCGNLDASGWDFSVGALWFYGPNPGNAVVKVSDLDIEDSSYSAIHFIMGDFPGVQLSNVSVHDVGTFVFQLQSSMTGSLQNVVATGRQQFGQYSCGSTLDFTGSGNSGFNSSHCGWLPRKGGAEERGFDAVVV